jgi:hypothetical protein
MWNIQMLLTLRSRLRWSDFTERVCGTDGWNISYFTMLYQLRRSFCVKWYDRPIEFSEFEKAGRKRYWPILKVLSLHSPGGTAQTTIILKDIKRLGRDTKRVPPKYNSEALSPVSTCSVTLVFEVIAYIKSTKSQRPPTTRWEKHGYQTF